MAEISTMLLMLMVACLFRLQLPQTLCGGSSTLSREFVLYGERERGGDPAQGTLGKKRMGKEEISTASGGEETVGWRRRREIWRKLAEKNARFAHVSSLRHYSEWPLLFPTFFFQTFLFFFFRTSQMYLYIMAQKPRTTLFLACQDGGSPRAL